MQKDFHYCCIRALTEAAGFSGKEAQIIAYASQYVDDATEHKGIKIAGVPDVADHLIEKGRFEPVCTAHKGIQYLTGLNKDVQRKVYIPFHFVPAEPYNGRGTYDYRVKPESTLANTILDTAIDFYKNAATEEKKQGLVKMGIALHAFADTWSHNRFSGRHSAVDNDIERIRVMREGKFEELEFLDQLKLNLIPDIGHAEAMNFPDQSQRTWRYEHDCSGKDVYRENTIEFLDAAEVIYHKLCAITGELPSWKSILSNISTCLQYPTDSMKRKFRIWKENFPEFSFRYNPMSWRAESLDGDRCDWEHFKTLEDFETLNFTGVKDPKWFLFHVEAKKQRKTIMNNIRQDLL